MMAIFMLPFSTLTRPAAPGEAVSPPPAYIAFPGRVRPWKIRAVFLMSYPVVSCRISLRPGGARSSPTAQEGTGRYRAPRDSPSERSVRSLNISFPGPKPSQHLPIVGTISRGSFWNDTWGYGERGRRVADVLLFLELWRCSSSPRTRDIGRLTVGVGRYLDVL